MSSSTALRYSRREADEAELRAGVVRLGALLGRDASVVARLEAVTGRDWICCGRDELLDVARPSENPTSHAHMARGQVRSIVELVIISRSFA